MVVSAARLLAVFVNWKLHKSMRRCVVSKCHESVCESVAAFVCIMQVLTYYVGMLLALCYLPDAFSLFPLPAHRPPLVRWELLYLSVVGFWLRFRMTERMGAWVDG